MMLHTKGEGGPAKRWRYSISLFSKMGDKEGGGGWGQKCQKIGFVIYGRPLSKQMSTGLQGPAAYLYHNLCLIFGW